MPEGVRTARRGWCPMHYQRWRQHGDLNHSRASVPKRVIPLCSVAGCGKTHEAQGYCNKHYLRWKKYGDPEVVKASPRGTDHPNWKEGEIAYVTAHARVYSARGKADHCSIADCETGSTAYHWANLTGNYADIEDYVQMCASHHFRYDNKRRLTNPPEENFSAKGR